MTAQANTLCSRVSLIKLFDVSWRLSVRYVAVLAFAGMCIAQTDQKPNSDTPRVIKLFVPAYPPMARIARVQGDVEVRLTIGRDGQVQSAVAVDGPPLLRPVALDSAQRSAFVCVLCESAAISLECKFEIVSRDEPKTMKDCEAIHDPPPAQVDILQRQITVFAEPVWLCDPTVRRVRAAKCLWLWRCGEVVEK